MDEALVRCMEGGDQPFYRETKSESNNSNEDEDMGEENEEDTEHTTEGEAQGGVHDGDDDGEDVGRPRTSSTTSVPRPTLSLWAKAAENIKSAAANVQLPPPARRRQISRVLSADFTAMAGVVATAAGTAAGTVSDKGTGLAGAVAARLRSPRPPGDSDAGGDAKDPGGQKGGGNKSKASDESFSFDDSWSGEAVHSILGDLRGSQGVGREKEEAEEQAGKEAEEQVGKEAKEKVGKEAEEQARKEAEEQARKEAEEQARTEAEEQARQATKPMPPPPPPPDVAPPCPRRQTEGRSWMCKEMKARRLTKTKAPFGHLGSVQLVVDEEGLPLFPGLHRLSQLKLAHLQQAHGLWYPDSQSDGSAKKRRKSTQSLLCGRTLCSHFLLTDSDNGPKIAAMTQQFNSCCSGCIFYCSTTHMSTVV
jgi:hypothetical protein